MFLFTTYTSLCLFLTYFTEVISEPSWCYTPTADKIALLQNRIALTRVSILLGKILPLRRCYGAVAFLRDFPTEELDICLQLTV